ncbi:hypothetical protein [Nocardioides pacificus]
MIQRLGHTVTVLPRFEIVARLRPVALVAPSFVDVDLAWDTAAPASSRTPAPRLAPYAAVTAELAPGAAGRLTLQLTSGTVTLAGWWDAPSGRAGLEVTDAHGHTTHHRSRRHGGVAGVAELGLTLTGTHLSVLTRTAPGGGSGTGEADPGWTVRGRVDLADRLDTRAESFLAGIEVGHRWSGAQEVGARRLRAGAFGQLGLRDVRTVTDLAGSPLREDGRLLLTATHAGPGFFDTAHTGVWALDPTTHALEHRADLFFRRPDRPGAFGDHSTHLVRTDDGWLAATSTWGDFDRARAGARVDVTLARSDADLLTGAHLLSTEPLDLPTTSPTEDLRSVGVWDPHLVRTERGWLVGFVSASRFFRFHPALAEGPSLDRLTLRAADSRRTATEGTTLVPLTAEDLDPTDPGAGDAALAPGWFVLASDGRDSRRGDRRRFPVLDLGLRVVGALDAPYPTNIPWPTLVREGDGWLMVTFDGSPRGGELAGYGTHGDIVLMRADRV